MMMTRTKWERAACCRYLHKIQSKRLRLIEMHPSHQKRRIVAFRVPVEAEVRMNAGAVEAATPQEHATVAAAADAVAAVAAVDAGVVAASALVGVAAAPADVAPSAAAF